jgi:stearoyl-CoA desaturase (Delta-9 desaturase)
MPGKSFAIIRWFDSWAGIDAVAGDTPHRVDWMRCLPFILLHASCLLVLVVGWSPFAVALAAGLYLVRMFALTGFYHRYFSHRTFKTSRPAQFLFAVLANSAVQRGPLWWASHHRHHHSVTDEPQDPHSPRQHGLLWSHVGWVMSRANFAPRLERISDFARFAELRFLDRFDVLVPAAGGALVYGLGALLARYAPGLGTSGPQLLVWSIVSTVVLLHGTFTINSLAHRIGRRRYAVRDDSRNSLVLALLTLGEGWHNNHHRYPASTRQSHRWWEIDPTWYALLLLARLGVIWDLKAVPAELLLRTDG